MKPLLATIAIVGLVHAAGCSKGPKIVPASGTVVFEDGSPVKVGKVETKSLQFEGVQASGDIASDGSFELTTFSAGDGAAIGEHQCVVVQFIMSEDIPNFRPSTLGVVNPQHSSYATSGLKITLPETGSRDLKLVVKGVKPRGGVTSKHEGHERITVPPDGKSNP